MANYSIKHWAEDDRPREKMLLKGTAALSNAELLAILINNGTREKNAVDVAKQLLQLLNNDLQKLGRLSVKELQKLGIKGIGSAKAISIAAAMELGIRRESAMNKKDNFTDSKDVAAFLRAELQHKKHEVFAVIFLNQANRINHYEIVSEGGITATTVDSRIILKKALEHNAIKLILCHNHPSGNLKPSRADEAITQKIVTAALALDMKVIDHIIVSDEGYYSFADQGML